MKKRLREPKPLHPIVAASTGPALIKHLASCNTTIRSQSLKQLQSWLLQSQPQDLADSDLKKLWKGLFYCLWHSDKTPNQVALIDRLTSLFLSLDSSLSLDFFRGFLVTLRREWPGIDRLRLDKFYLLIRRFIKTLFELMRLRKWDVEVMKGYFGVLEKDGFLAEDELKGNGVNYHIASVFLEELKGVGFPVTKEVVEVVFEPFLAAMAKSKDKIMLGKVRSCVFDELAKLGKQLIDKKKMGEECGEDGDVLLGVVALRMRLSGKLYAAGSSVDCVQGNRKVVLGLHQEFLKLEKELESSKVEIVLPEYNYEAGDEVPQLIPIDCNNTSNGDVKLDSLEGSENGDQHDDDDEGPKKKRKKTKKGVDGDDEKLKKKTKKGVDGDVKKLKKKTKKGVDGDDVKLKKKIKKGVDGDDEKLKKTKKGVDGDDKKSKKKKKSKADNGVLETDPTVNTLTDNGVEGSLSEVGLSKDLESLGNDVVLNEAVISNLQKQFEMVAAENGLDDDDSDLPVTPMVKRGARADKRKRSKRAESQESGALDSNGAGEDGVDISAKSVKKVRFSMKNNIFWKPQTPLPPESLRLPPSVVPRGSALKKGVPPGPVIDTLQVKKNSNQKKKALKRMRSATPMIRRKRKTLTGSA